MLIDVDASLVCRLPDPQHEGYRRWTAEYWIGQGSLWQIEVAGWETDLIRPLQLRKYW